MTGAMLPGILPTDHVREREEDERCLPPRGALAGTWMSALLHVNHLPAGRGVYDGPTTSVAFHEWEHALNAARCLADATANRFVVSWDDSRLLWVAHPDLDGSLR